MSHHLYFNEFTHYASLVMLGSVMVAYPVCLILVVDGLKKKGKSVSVVWGLSILVAFLAVMATSIVIGYKLINPLNAYEILGVSRKESAYNIARVYLKWKKAFQSDEISIETWKIIDAAYDLVINKEKRLVYDFWGPEGENMNDEDHPELALNFLFYYIMWGLTLVTLTMGDNGKKSRGWGTTGLLAIFVLEVCVRAVNYEPPLPFFDKMIPHEMVHYAQLLFPCYLLFRISTERLYLIDVMEHRNVVLQSVKDDVEKKRKFLLDIKDAYLKSHDQN